MENKGWWPDWILGRTASPNSEQGAQSSTRQSSINSWQLTADDEALLRISVPPRHSAHTPHACGPHAVHQWSDSPSSLPLVDSSSSPPPPPPSLQIVPSSSSNVKKNPQQQQSEASESIPVPIPTVPQDSNSTQTPATSSSAIFLST